MTYDCVNNRKPYTIIKRTAQETVSFLLDTNQFYDFNQHPIICRRGH